MVVVAWPIPNSEFDWSVATASISHLVSVPRNGTQCVFGLHFVHWDPGCRQTRSDSASLVRMWTLVFLLDCSLSMRLHQET